MVLIRLFDGTRTRHRDPGGVPGRIPERDVEMSSSSSTTRCCARSTCWSSPPPNASGNPRGPQDGPPASRRAEGRGVRHLLSPVSRPRPRQIPESDGEVRAVDLEPAAVAVGLLCFGVGIRRHLSSLAAIWGGTHGALRIPASPPLGRHSVLLHPLDDRLRPRVRARLRDEVLRRRGARHRHRAAVLHSGLLLRHDRFAALREQVAPPLGDARPASTSRPSCASSPSSSGSCPTRTRC